MGLISKYRENQTEEHCENAHSDDNHNPSLADVSFLRGGLRDQNHAQQDCSIFTHIKDISFKISVTQQDYVSLLICTKNLLNWL
jgi:hypothetical protein